MLIAKLDGKLLKNVVDAINAIAPEAATNFNFEPDGLMTQVMDKNHVALISLKIFPTAFHKYKCLRTCILGFKIDILSKLMRLLRADDTATITYDETNPDLVKIIFDGEKHTTTSEFDVKLLDVDQDHMNIPEHVYQCSITMPSKELERACRELGNLFLSSGGEKKEVSKGDVIITVTKAGISLRSVSDYSTGTITIRHEQDQDDMDGEEKDTSTCVVNASSDKLTQRYALKYLDRFARSSTLSNTVEMSMSVYMLCVAAPVHIPQRTGKKKKKDEEEDEDAGKVVGSIEYFLAPKADEEED